MMVRAVGDREEAIVRVVPSMADIEAMAWDRCANPPSFPFDPFVSHAFLKALEEAGTTGPDAGWIPQHLLLEDASGRVAAAMPLYVKTHSQGEYVFDHAWASALHRAGGQYYPKLQAAVPFTPVPGRRLLVPPGPSLEIQERLLANAGIQLARQLDCSSFHITFLTESEWTRLGAAGLLQRTCQQFHWTNEGYSTFDDFLATLSSRKRKMIRRERAEALSGGLTIEHITGRDITEDHWDTFFAFYIDTGDRKWGSPYLNRRFFSLLGAAMADHCLLMMVKRGDETIAGALHIVGGDCLYGRYWGATELVPFLHFEVCYYQAIDYAIAHGLQRVEAGAQGEHKLARGYRPVTTYSAHWLAETGLHQAVERYLCSEREEVSEVNRLLEDYGPYKKGPA